MQGPPDGHDDGWLDDPDDADTDLPSLHPPASERTWVHPSEVGMDQRGRTDRRRGSVLAGGLVIGGLGLLVLGVLMGVGWGGDDDPLADSSPVDVLGPSLAALTVVTSTGQATATGIVLDGDGHLATRASTLAGSEAIWATCGGRPPERAQVVATDPQADVAVLHVPTASGRAAVTGGRARTGQTVLVVRAGAGEEEPTTWSADVAAAGVHLVRADGTVTESLFRTAAVEPSLPTTTAAAGTGSTVMAASRVAASPVDGAVFDGRGRFLGLVVGADGRSQDVVPAATVTSVARELLEQGRVERSWLGLTTVDAPASAGHPSGTGAVVVAVHPGGPAAAAGLRVGDVVVSIGDRDVDRMVDLAASLQRLEVGSTTQLAVVRDGQRRLVSVTTSAGPGPTTTVAPPP